MLSISHNNNTAFYLHWQTCWTESGWVLKMEESNWDLYQGSTRHRGGGGGLYSECRSVCIGSLKCSVFVSKLLRFIWLILSLLIVASIYIDMYRWERWWERYLYNRRESKVWVRVWFILYQGWGVALNLWQWTT